MNICLDIDFKGSIVCILGGGKVALRKARAFLKAEARVYLYSLETKEDFSNLPVFCVSKDEFYEKLKNAKLAIACTDDEKVNMNFIKQARAWNVLTMSCQQDQGQDAFSMVMHRDKDLTLACHTNGAFPVANRAILEDWENRLQLLKTIRLHLKDHELCKDLLQFNEEHLYFIHEALRSKQGIVYLLHGNNAITSKLQIRTLTSYVHAKKKMAVTYFFMAPKYRDLILSTFCKILRDLEIQIHFVLLFWKEGHYIQNAKEALEEYGFSYQWIHIDPLSFVKKGEALIQHTSPNVDDKDTVLVSMLDSPFLRKQYPKSRFVACLEDKDIVERICNETNPSI